MFTRLFLLISLISLWFFFYGIYFTIVDNSGENDCRMTYMFEYPQFVRIHFKGNRKFLKYGLYAYSEGLLTERARSMKFNGAPVIFVPGNSGSYKQARSLASVALQKSFENKRVNYVDYFTVSFHEEYTALFGGYLEDQKEFLKLAITTVLNLYKNLENSPKQVILIGHSMGGKIAQSLLSDSEISPLINTIIAIAAPLDRPVLKMDFYFEAFYRNSNSYLGQNMNKLIITNETNYCGGSSVLGKQVNRENNTSPLNNVLLISIGGGTKDIQVNSALAHSVYSDIHALATSIPNVWLSMDHLCAVWCLQLVLVVNRFLYSVLYIPKGKMLDNHGQSFIMEKDVRLSKASHFFVKQFRAVRGREMNLVARPNDLKNWIEDSRRVYTEKFQYGLNDTRTQMIRLLDLPMYNTLSVETINMDSEDWVFGCAANEIHENMRYCSKGTSLSHFVKNLPSTKYKRQHLYLDLHKLKRSNPTWTHIVLRLHPTREFLQINIDVHDPGAREINTVMPKWYSYSKVNLLTDTISGTSLYRLKLSKLDEIHQSLQLEIIPGSCAEVEHHAVIEVCVPWARGSKRYHFVTNNKSLNLFIYTPENKPFGYNSTENPILVNMHLDPTCRYGISMKNSLGGTLSRVVQQSFHWLPAHLVAILLLSLIQQLSATPRGNMKFKCGTLHVALVHCSSFFLISATRVFAKILSSFEFLPEPDDFNQSMVTSVVIHGSAISVLSLMIGGLWVSLNFSGKFAHMALIRLLNVPLPTITSVIVPIVQKFPLIGVVLLFSIGNASCGGLCLICACVIYFILMTKQYEDYLEEFVYHTAEMLAEKLFGRKGKNIAKDANVTEPAGEKCEKSEEKEVDGPPTYQGICQETSNLGNKPSEMKEMSEVHQRQMDDINHLIREAYEEKLKSLNEDKSYRKEYDSIHEGLSCINFHMTLFLLLFLLTVINLPSTLSWAKNYSNSAILFSDPSYVPAMAVLTALSVIWQLETPKNVYGYPAVQSVLYVCAAICLVYCQDSIYRLNAVIATVFGFIALHQVIAPERDVDPAGDISDDEWKERLEKFKDLFNEDSSTLSENPTS